MDEYVDEGRTATDDNRPAFQTMLHRVTSHDERVHAIVVHSFSRVHRNVTDLALYLRKLRTVGTRLVSVTQDVDDTVSGPNLGLMEAALTHARATVTTVPSFMSNWRGVAYLHRSELLCMAIFTATAKILTANNNARCSGITVL